MESLVVLHHIGLLRKKLGARGAHAWNLTLNRLLLVATRILLATNPHMLVHVMLRGEGRGAEWAGKCNSLVVLRPGVGVVGAWVDAQLGGVLWTIVDEHLLELQHVLDGPGIVMN